MLLLLRQEGVLDDLGPAGLAVLIAPDLLDPEFGRAAHQGAQVTKGADRAGQDNGITVPVNKDVGEASTRTDRLDAPESLEDVA